MQGLDTRHQSLIEDIAINNGFTDLEVHTSPGSKKGDNYMGIITSVTLNSYNNKMDLVLKASHDNQEFREAACVRNAFSREVYFYEKVLPELDKFQKEKRLPHPFQGYARYYGSYMDNTTECLVMEDIRKSGFSMWNRKVPMNEGHITAVLEEYAKLHSVAVALQEKNPDIFDEIKQNMTDIYADDYLKDDTKLRGFTGQMMSKVLKITNGYESATKAIQDFLPQIPSYYKYGLLDPEYQRVFIHGDCWCNNLMFTYRDQSDVTKPTNTCVLDWQLSKYSSPGLDLVYFLFCSADKSILNNYKQHLRNYYRVFSQNLISAGCDPDIVFPFSLLEKHFRRFAKFGLIMATLNLQIILCDESEAPDLSSTTDGDLTEIMNIKSSNMAESNQRILDLVLFMVENCLF